MEQLVQQHGYNPRVEHLVKSFQTAAGHSLNGPGRDYLTILKQQQEEYRKSLVTQPTTNLKPPATSPEPSPSPKMTELGPFYTSPPLSVPFFIQTDSSRGEKSETVLEGETIACFIVGGEKRLCLPQILNSVLRDFNLQDINTVCDELHIFCSRCNQEQLETLKINGILPPNARSCGLITKTDAERLCNALLYRSPEKNGSPPSLNSFKVYHECFGKCKGMFCPELYATPNSKCIQCCDCYGMFSPQKFVCHSHKALENRTCHWGFDSANWRSYLLLAKDQEFADQLQRFMDDLKLRFDVMNRYKRKESPGSESDDGKKRSRYDENTAPSSSKVYDSIPGWLDSVAQLRQMSAFRPWSPSLLNILKDAKVPLTCRDGVPVVLPSYLQTGPPVLANPDRVIPHTDSKMYKRTFAPNVSLAPQPYKKDRDFDEDSEVDVMESSTQGPVPEAPFRKSVGVMAMKAEDLSELELSSSSDTDSSVPSTPRGTDPRSALLSQTPELQLEIEMVRQALDGRVGESREARERFMEDFLHIQRRTEEKIQNLIRSRMELQQELELVKLTKSEKLHEALEAKRKLRRELERLRQTHEVKVTDFEVKVVSLEEENKKLRVELESQKMSKTPDILRLKNKYRGEVEELQSQLEVSQQKQADMEHEITQLRQQLHKLQLSSHETATVTSTKPDKPVHETGPGSGLENGSIDAERVDPDKDLGTEKAEAAKGGSGKKDKAETAATMTEVAPPGDDRKRAT